MQLHKYTNKVWVEGDAPKVVKNYHIGQGSQVSVWKMQNPPCLLCLVLILMLILDFTFCVWMLNVDNT